MGSEEYYKENQENVKPGDKVERDVDFAANQYLKAAQMDYVPAMTNLASLLFRSAKTNRRLLFGPTRIQKDQDLEVYGDDQEDMYFEAANWARLALQSDPNIADANFLLGVLYEQGLSVDQNHEVALKYYEIAAHLGHTKSFTKLGHLLYSGVKKPEFMSLDPATMAQFGGLGGGPRSGYDEAMMYSKLPDRNLAVKYY